MSLLLKEPPLFRGLVRQGAGSGLRLRPYQLEAQAAVREAWDRRTPGDPHPLLVLATGTGKTETALGLIREAVAAGERVLFVAHRKELVESPWKRWVRYYPGERHLAGILQGEADDCRSQFVCASVATLARKRRLDRLLAHGGFDLVVVDEAHHSVSPVQQRVIDRCLGTSGRAVGLTATPDRSDQLDLGSRWEVAYTYSILDALRDGWLAKPWRVVRRLPGIEERLKLGARKDYDEEEAWEALRSLHVVEHTVEAFQAVLEDAQRIPSEVEETEGVPVFTPRSMRALVFTSTKEQARLTADALTRVGIESRAVTADTPEDERDRFLAAYLAGTVQVLCNPAVLTEGTDLPPTDLVVLARPTASWVLYVQQVGRGARLFLPSPWDNSWGDMNREHPAYRSAGGKRHFCVLDLMGATDRHHLVGAPVLVGAPRCRGPYGGHEFPASGGKTCIHCGKRVSCLVDAKMGGDGVHSWNSKGICALCAAGQCPDMQGEDQRHTWVRDFSPPEPKRVCTVCGATAALPKAGPPPEKREKERPADAEWLRLPGTSPQLFGVYLPPHGSLLVEDLGNGTFAPYWVRQNGRKALRLSQTPVARESVRVVVDDLVRRAEALERDGRTVYGGLADQAMKDMTRAKLLNIASGVGLVRS